MMDVIQEYFTCDQCDCKDFKLIYNFSLKFHNINFSDDLIYDRTVDKIYQCVNCNKTYSTIQVEERLQAIKVKRKKAGVD